MTERRTCNAVNQSGEPCGMMGGIDSTGRCLWHSEIPERIEKRRKARQKGAEVANKKRAARTTVSPDDAPDRPETLNDIADWLRWLTVAATTGEMDSRTADVVRQLLKELRHTLGDVEDSEKVKELQERLEKLKTRAT